MMKALLVVMLLWDLATADPILTGPKPWLPGTVIYHANEVTLESVSGVAFDKTHGQHRVTVKFRGEWQIHPNLQGVDLYPQTGIIVCADTSDLEKTEQLQKLHDRCLALRNKKVDIFIYPGAVNNNRATYASPEQIKIVPSGGSK